VREVHAYWLGLNVPPSTDAWTDPVLYVDDNAHDRALVRDALRTRARLRAHRGQFAREFEARSRAAATTWC
jgi:hypothetical protein